MNWFSVPDPVITNNLTAAVENHVEDQLAPDLFMDTSEQFETLSQVSLNSLDSADDSADYGDADGFTNKTEEFIENPKQSEILGNCFGNDKTALSLKMRRLRPCRSHEEVNTELKIRIMKEIRKPGRSKYKRNQFWSITTITCNFFFLIQCCIFMP